MKKKLFWMVLLALVILAAIIYPWYKLQTQNQVNREQEENQAIASSFAQYYGAQASISNITAPKIIRAVYWTDVQYMHASLYIDGVWFEYAREAALRPAPTPVPTFTPAATP